MKLIIKLLVRRLLRERYFCLNQLNRKLEKYFDDDNCNSRLSAYLGNQGYRFAKKLSEQDCLFACVE